MTGLRRLVLFLALLAPEPLFAQRLACLFER
jgi:hypothetical protein